MPRTVYVVNKSAHDFSKAKGFGRLKFLSEGSMNRYSTNNMHRQFEERFEGSKVDDYILVCGLSIMNVIASSVFACKHRRLNLLIFKQGEYIERNHVFHDECASSAKPTEATDQTDRSQ